ncbi:hypothetical protein [Psychroflexus halocasei]|uniref:Uncharacterized protein n=1 Tax=Psychroflexus halocasei TaxID=908615 RepID=A0A1H4BE61_9FLAO|nr:hypothetical protein [Psychroflexus halocasei]SEA46334.1 hypothetical protein SAMN05421540_1063 [Psychroflexus halocasei]
MKTIFVMINALIFLTNSFIVQNTSQEELMINLITHKEISLYVDAPLIYKNELSENFQNIALTADKEYRDILVLRALKKIKSNKELYKVGVFIPFENVYIEFECLEDINGCWDIKILSSVEY